VSAPNALGRYQIQGVRGKGAMDLVYDGLDPKLKGRVAIKTILIRKLDGEAARMIRRRFEREVRALARLNPSNIAGCTTSARPRSCRSRPGSTASSHASCQAVRRALRERAQAELRGKKS
jgi:serine/threonine protein kinase